jgi:hypothetical protein
LKEAKWEEKLGTVRSQLGRQLERAYFEVNRTSIALRTRVARGELSY